MNKDEELRRGDFNSFFTLIMDYALEGRQKSYIGRDLPVVLLCFLGDYGDLCCYRGFQTDFRDLTATQKLYGQRIANDIFKTFIEMNLSEFCVV